MHADSFSYPVMFLVALLSKQIVLSLKSFGYFLLEHFVGYIESALFVNRIMELFKRLSWIAIA